MKRLIVSLVAALTLLAPTNASAATYVATYEGFLETTGTDSVFGQLSAGDHFIARYTFDVSTVGARYSSSGSDINGREFYDGSGAANPITSAVLTIGTISHAFATTGFGRAYTENDVFNRDLVQHDTRSQNGRELLITQLVSSDLSLLTSRSVETPLSLSQESTRSSFFQTPETSRFFMRATSLSVVSSAVPEPGTWALMLLGFFGIGGMMRLRGDRQRGALNAV